MSEVAWLLIDMKMNRQAIIIRLLMNSTCWLGRVRLLPIGVPVELVVIMNMPSKPDLV